MTFYKSASLIIFILFIASGECSVRDHPLLRIFRNELNNELLTDNCKNDLTIFLQKLESNRKEDIWAKKMLDATSKIPVSLISYNYNDLGNFDECISIETKLEKLKGKYCIGNAVLNQSIAEFYYRQYMKNYQHLTTSSDLLFAGRATWSLCLPSKCTKRDSEILMTKFQPFGIEIKGVVCQTIEDANPGLNRDSIIGISILSFIVLIVVCSTIYEIYYYYRESKGASPYFKSFSLYSNGLQLFRNPPRASGSSEITCLNGIRVISMIWIVSIHTWSIHTSSGPIYNSKGVIQMTNSVISMVFDNGALACDTFLMVGGLLVTYNYFKKSSSSLSWSFILKHYLHRLFRITPALAAVILVSGTLLRHMGSGPKWPFIVDNFEMNCKKNWWSALFFIQNEVNVNEMCVGHSWYLDVDMQLFIFSPLIFWILSKFPKSGLTCISAATFLSIALSFYRAFEDQLPGLPSNIYSKTPVNVYMNEYYLKTETRGSPWLMGIILGYLLTKQNFTNILLPKKISIPMWFLSFCVLFLCVFSGLTLQGPDYNKFQNAFYIALIRPSFCMSVGWIIWACFTKQGGIVNGILSMQIFTFLNKFIYSMYLLHVTSVYMIFYGAKTSIYINWFNIAFWFWGIFMFMFGLSIIWVLVFELPFVALEKILLSPLAKKEKTKLPNLPHEIKSDEYKIVVHM